MTRAHDLYKRKTQAELLEMQQAITSDPANRTPPEQNSIYLYTPKARKKLEDIAWAIRYHLDDKRETKAADRS